MCETTGDHSPLNKRQVERLEARCARREQALRDIKRIHTEWFHDVDLGTPRNPDQVIREIERIVVSVWESEDP